MQEPDKLVGYTGLLDKARAVLDAVRAGERRIEAIVIATGLGPATVIRVASLLRDMRQLDQLKKRGTLELLPIFQPRGALPLQLSAAGAGFLQNEPDGTGAGLDCLMHDGEISMGSGDMSKIESLSAVRDQLHAQLRILDRLGERLASIEVSSAVEILNEQIGEVAAKTDVHRLQKRFFGR